MIICLSWAKWGDDRGKTTTGISLMLFYLGTTVLLVKKCFPLLGVQASTWLQLPQDCIICGRKEQKKNKIKLNQKGIPPILFEPKGPLLPVFTDQKKKTSWSSLFAPGCSSSRFLAAFETTLGDSRGKKKQETMAVSVAF